MIDSFRDENAFLSNFYPITFYLPVLNDFVPTSEHGFMALKTIDPAEQHYVLSAATPGQAKRRGRSVTLREDWDRGARVRAMQTVLVAKFSEPDMQQRLIETGTQLLVEGNTWHDNFWGVCACAECADVTAKNMLGELLMAIRAGINGGLT